MKSCIFKNRQIVMFFSAVMFLSFGCSDSNGQRGPAKNGSEPPRKKFSENDDSPIATFSVGSKYGTSAAAAATRTYRSGNGETTKVFERPGIFIVKGEQGKKAAQIWSKRTSVIIEAGVVKDIRMLPMKNASNYKTAVKTIVETLDKLGVAADNEIRKQMRAWPTDAGSFNEGYLPRIVRATGALSEDKSLFVAARPTSNGKWYAAVYVNLNLEDRWQLKPKAQRPPRYR